MNSPTTRLCRSCGSVVTADEPCVACALAGAFTTLGLDQPRSTPAPSFAPLDLPSPFGVYRVLREIAAGGMGVVYEAEDTRLGRPVALKMLRRVFFASEQERIRFRSEAEFSSQLDHPHIVPIHEVGEVEGQPYFTMKIIKGGNLADRLEDGPIPTREGAILMGKIARAVHHAHQHGVMHRDLKPSNILLDEAGEPWLTDFGLAKALHVDSGLTLTQTMMGTPDYMSPEQVEGRPGEISTATDVWALGVILYQVLTGCLPFHGASNSEILRKVREKEPPAPSTIMPRGDRDLETLCLRCLEKEPARRLGSAGELADDLDRWMRGEPIRARPITGIERTGKWLRRHPYRATALAAFLVVVLGAGAAVTWQWRRALHSEQRALASAAAESRTSYAATLSSALAARERHDFGQARRLLAGIPPAMRQFDWRLLDSLCRGDEALAYHLGSEPADEPQSISMTPTGDSLAILTADGRFHIRGLDGKETRPPQKLPPMAEGDESADVHRYYGLCHSPDGRRLAYAKGNVLHILDAELLTTIHELTSVRPQFAWLDNDRLLYGFNGSVAAPPWPDAGAWILHLDDAQGPDEDVRTTPFPGMCAPLAVSPDRSHFVLHRVNTEAWSWKRSLHVYEAGGDLASVPAEVYSMPGDEYPGELVLSQRGRYLAFTAGNPLKRTVRILDLSRGEVIVDHEFRFPVNALAIDPDENLLGLVSSDSVVRLYEFTRGSPEDASLNTYDDDVIPARCEQIDPQGAHAPPRDLGTRSAQDGRARFFLGHEQRVMDITFDGSGSFFTAGGDGSIRRWRETTPRPFVRLGFQTDLYDFRHPAASSDGLHVLTHGIESHAHRCDVARSRRSANHQVLATSALQAPLAVFADGRPVTFDFKTGEVVVWTEERGQFQESMRFADSAPFGHDYKTRRGVLSRDETRMAGAVAGRLFCVDFETRVVTWGLEKGTRLGVHASHDLSPDGEWIASSDLGPHVTIHRFGHPDEIVTRLGPGVRDYDTAVAFSRDGERLYVGNHDGRVRVWDVATWKERPELSWLAHRGAVTAIAVSHDGSLVATSGGDSLKLFPADPEPGERYRRERLSFWRERPANWIQFGRDASGRDRALLHSAPARALEIWEADLASASPTPDSLIVPVSLPTASRYHGAVLLRNGEVLLMGGLTRAGLVSSECFLVDPVTGSWRKTGSLLVPRYGALDPVLLPDGTILVSGGIGRGKDELRSSERYDPEQGTWSRSGDMITARAMGRSLQLGNGKVLAVGGFDGNRFSPPCELYDPETATWSPTGGLTWPRVDACYVLLGDGSVLAAGGRAESSESPVSEIYDPQAGTWSDTGAPLVERASAAACLLPNGEVLLLGGHDRGLVPLASCERYDPATGRWREAAPMPGPMFAHRTEGLANLLPDGIVLVAGGKTGDHRDHSQPDPTCYRYDAGTDSWHQSAELRSPRYWHSTTLLNDGRLLLIGGVTARGLTGDIEIYPPDK